MFLGESAPNFIFGKYNFGKNRNIIQEVLMRKIGYKGRCEKKTLSKCKEVCRTYDPIQSKYAELPLLISRISGHCRIVPKR